MDKNVITIIALILALIGLAKGIGQPEAKQGQNAPVLATPTPCPVKEIQGLLSQHNIDPKIVASVIQTESSWNPEAKGSSGEVGLMQLMPDTARFFSVKDRTDPIENVKGGIKFLAYCKEKTGKAYLRCYNAGEFKTELPTAKLYEKKVLALANRKLTKNS